MRSADPILFARAPARGQTFAAEWREQAKAKKPAFCCVLAHTDTCLIPGISAAGLNEELRAFTPAADAEVVCTGQPRCLPRLPSHPSGVPGPAAITRAALGLAGIEPRFVAAGLRVWPAAPVSRVECQPGGSVVEGCAVPEAARLFEEGCRYGRELAQRSSYLVLGESVPGGTTSALALLLALGIPASGRVSGSVPDNSHPLKQAVVERGLAAAGLCSGDGQADPLGAVSRIGDPMQPLAAGIALASVEAGRPVLLAGGSQMVAVAALLQALRGAAALDRVVVGTTRWVIDDPGADVAGLSANVSPDLPLLAVNLDFSASRHAGLRAYERCLVKEGVGAGGACLAALLSGASLDQLHRAIDLAYDALV